MKCVEILEEVCPPIEIKPVIFDKTAAAENKRRIEREVEMKLQSFHYEQQDDSGVYDLCGVIVYVERVPDSAYCTSYFMTRQLTQHKIGTTIPEAPIDDNGNQSHPG